jgi:sulfite exporter TauE/SafE
MSWIKKMQDKWELKSFWQVIIVLVVFALTGSTVLLIKGPILDIISGGNEREWWMTAIYIMLILPIYNIILLCYGFLLGQFAFFWKYEQKMLRRFGIKPARWEQNKQD